MLAPALMLILAAPPADDPPVPSPAELFALYRANYDAFRTLKLQWRREHRSTPARKAAEEARILALQARLDRMNGAEPAFQEVSQELFRRRQALMQSQVPKSLFQTFLTDRTRFMMRNAPLGWEASHPASSWLMPDVPVTEQSMVSTYQGFTLIVYGGDVARGVRWASPYLGGVSAMIRMGLYVDDRSYLPPLSTDSAVWNGNRHPIDAFFSENPGAFAAVGREAMAGRECVKIERRTGRVVPVEVADKARADGRKVEQFEVVRAWLDPDRGALPLRIEWWSERTLDGQPDPAWSHLDHSLEITEIQQIPGAGAFPTKGVQKIYGASPQDAAKESAGEIPLAPPTVPYEETTWEVGAIEANKPLQETFALPFPKGTYYNDEINGTYMRSGDEGVNQAVLPWTLCGVVVAGWAVYGLIASAMWAARRGRAARAAA